MVLAWLQALDDVVEHPPGFFLEGMTSLEMLGTGFLDKMTPLDILNMHLLFF